MKPSPGTVSSGNKFQGDAARPHLRCTVLVPRYQRHVSSDRPSQCFGVPAEFGMSSAEGPSPAASALKPASSTPSSATRPPGSPGKPRPEDGHVLASAIARSVAPWTRKHCRGMWPGVVELRGCCTHPTSRPNESGCAKKVSSEVRSCRAWRLLRFRAAPGWPFVEPQARRSVTTRQRARKFMEAVALTHAALVSPSVTYGSNLTVT